MCMCMCLCAARCFVGDMDGHIEIYKKGNSLDTSKSSFYATHKDATTVIVQIVILINLSLATCSVAVVSDY